MTRALNGSGVPHLEEPIYRVTASSFTKAIRRGKRSQAENGWMVDLHSKSEYKKMRCFLTPDGKTGVAIKRNGDVVSVFSTSGKRNAMGKIIPFAVANGGRKLDCYAFNSDRSLHNLYGRFGAKATGRTRFNADYAPPGYNPNGPTPHSVVAMTLPSSLRGVTAGYRRYQKGKRINLLGVREFSDYDDMIKDRDSRLANRGRAKGLRGAFGSGG